MSTRITTDASAPSTTAVVVGKDRNRSDRPADRFMRALLRIPQVDHVAAVDAKTNQGAHRAFRLSLVISGLRCLATYLVIPILVPVVSFAGVVVAPVGIALCLVAMVSGIAGVRRFWISDHRAKWIYTWFMAFVFITLAIFLVTDITRLVT